MSVKHPRSTSDLFNRSSTTDQTDTLLKSNSFLQTPRRRSRCSDLNIAPNYHWICPPDDMVGDPTPVSPKDDLGLFSEQPVCMAQAPEINVSTLDLKPNPKDKILGRLYSDFPALIVFPHLVDCERSLNLCGRNQPQFWPLHRRWRTCAVLGKKVPHPPPSLLVVEEI